MLEYRESTTVSHRRLHFYRKTGATVPCQTLINARFEKNWASGHEKHIGNVLCTNSLSRKTISKTTTRTLVATVAVRKCSTGATTTLRRWWCVCRRSTPIATPRWEVVEACLDQLGATTARRLLRRTPRNTKYLRLLGYPCGALFFFVF